MRGLKNRCESNFAFSPTDRISDASLPGIPFKLLSACLIITMYSSGKYLLVINLSVCLTKLYIKKRTD